MTTKSDKRNITAIVARYRIQSNVVEIMAQMLGVLVQHNQAFPLKIESISGEILVKFESMGSKIGYGQLMRMINSTITFPNKYSYYMLSAAGEFIIRSTIGTINHEEKRCGVYNNDEYEYDEYNEYDIKYYSDYIDLYITDTITIIFTNSPTFKDIVHGYPIRRITNLHRCKCKIIRNIDYYCECICMNIRAYEIHYNLLLINEIFGDMVYRLVKNNIKYYDSEDHMFNKSHTKDIITKDDDIVNEIIKRNDSVNHKIDDEIDRLLDWLHFYHGVTLNLRRPCSPFPDSDPRIINGKILQDAIDSVRKQITDRYVVSGELRALSYKTIRVALFRHKVIKYKCHLRTEQTVKYPLVYDIAHKNYQ